MFTFTICLECGSHFSGKKNSKSGSIQICVSVCKPTSIVFIFLSTVYMWFNVRNNNIVLLFSLVNKENLMAFIAPYKWCTYR